MRGFEAVVDARAPGRPVSAMLYGIFLEDINFSCDGGLNANLVNNFSFDGVYLSRRHYSEARAFLLRPAPRAVADRLRYWRICGGELESRHADGVAEASWYARVLPRDGCRLENRGHDGGRAALCAMPIRPGQAYHFSCWARAGGPGAGLRIWIEDDAGTRLTDTAEIAPGTGWGLAEVELASERAGRGKLVLGFAAGGWVDLDAVCFRPADVWRAGDARWSQGRMRRDLVESIQALRPRFMRFPGGCIVEGSGPDNEYDWRDTVGPVVGRRHKYNLWGAHLPDGGYTQSGQIGFYEYFLLCEDLGMEPVPTLFAGLNCQFRSRCEVHAAEDAFHARVVAPYLDLIEYATGDPARSRWAALRAEAGHAAPFRLNYIGIGNENHGAAYLRNFTIIKQAVQARLPGVTCIMAAGAFPAGRAFDAAWRAARDAHPDVIVDEHCYHRPGWFSRAHRRFDAYDRAGPRVYMGEYAANFPLNLPLLSLKPNCLRTALAEAAFLTGVERNADIVAMTSYAPLLSLAGGTQWAHNLINFSPDEVLLTANYFVQAMFAGNLGDWTVPVAGRLPDGVFASATRRADTVFLKLVNTTGRDVMARLTLPGCGDGDADGDMLQADDADLANDIKFTGAPAYRVRPAAVMFRITNEQLQAVLRRRGVYVLRIGVG